MPIIPFLGYDSRFVAEAALVTDKEFEEWLTERIMPKAYIVTAFIKKYFEKNKLSIDLDKIIKEDKISIETLYPAHLSVESIKVILAELKLNYQEFIDDYAIYLKTL